MATVTQLDRRMLAIMVADVVGYSHSMEADEAGTIARLRAARADVADPLIGRHNGRVVKLMGDGALVAFDSVVDAVACAIAIQTAMAARNAGLPEAERIVFRIGINLGDVALVDGDLYGDGVNVAARLEQACEPGGVLVSGTAFDHLQGKLDLPLEPAGELRVKNIARPVRAFRVRLDGTTLRRFGLSGIARRATVLVMAALAALVLAVGVWRLWPPEAPPASRPGIAVLPFDNRSGDQATSRLADGLTDDIITDLAAFRDLDVIARNSTESYKGKPVDIRQLGRDLGVSYVLQGSIQHQGARVRVTAQLIDAKSGAHVWSERWDRESEDVFAVQSEVAERVANQLASYGVLANAGRVAAKRKRPANLGAYDFYLLGTEARHRNTKEGIEEGIRLLMRAVEMDPNLARAWVGLAWARGHTMHFGGDPAVARRGREEAARRAVELDPMDAEAHAALASGLGQQGKLAQAEAELDKALSLGPTMTSILVSYIERASQLGRPEKGAEMTDRLIRLDPSYPRRDASIFHLSYFMAGRYDDALRIIDRIPSETLRIVDLVTRATALAALGRVDQARAAAGEVLARYPDFSIERYVMLQPSWNAAERKLLIETMRAAGFPPCAKPAETAKVENPIRLPECEKTREAK